MGREWTPPEPLPGEAEQAAREAAVAVAGADFWGAHELLAQVQGWARARRAGPYALLGEILLQVMARVPPNVVLPPLGSYDEKHPQGSASLNQIYASVGPSGLSKGLAHSIATQVTEWPAGLDAPVYASLGTGEGIASTFTATTRDPDTKQYVTVRLAWSALFSATEIDKFAALNMRKGTTLGGTLRSAWSGEPLGEANASEERRRYVPRGGYRVGVVVHVQPDRGGALLNEEEAAGGTPQRILWLPAPDPDIPDTAPEPPGRIAWRPPAEVARANADLKASGLDHVADLTPVLLPVCASALSEIDRAAVARHRGEAGALDGHALLVREKVAASLAIFLGRFGVTDADWALAGHLMGVSDATRGHVAQALRQAAERENDARGRAEAKRARMIRQSETADLVNETAKRILKVLGGEDENDGWMANSALRRSLSAPQRNYYDDALEMLAGNKLIETRKVSKGADGTGGTGTSYRIAK